MSFKGHSSISRHDGSTDSAWDTYICGHCGTKVSGAVVASFSWTDSGASDKTNINRWLLCTNCAKPSAKLNNEVFPGSPFGPSVQGLPVEVREAYQEARRCMEVKAFTAAELICRKILMYVATDKGADEGETFANYLSFLEENGYITPPMKPWVDLIRQHGNKATHKLEKSDEKRAQSSVMFTAELLRLVYEMEYMGECSTG